MLAEEKVDSGAVYEIQGRKVSMPAVVRDASSGTAIFSVPRSALEKLLPNDSLEVIESGPDTAQLVIGFVDYRDNDLGDYNEVMIVMFVKPRGAGDEEQGTYIYKLPVNQSFTCEAGAKIWGFPKTVEEIEIDYSDDSASCRLVMEGQHVFSIRLPRSVVENADDPDMEMKTYTALQGLTRIPFTQGGKGTAIAIGSEGVTIELGDHPLAGELRQLGLPKDADMSTWIENMWGTFGAPEKV